MSVLSDGRVLRGKVFNATQRDFFQRHFSVISHILPCLPTIPIYLLSCSSEFLFIDEAVNQRCDGEYQHVEEIFFHLELLWMGENLLKAGGVTTSSIQTIIRNT